MNTLSRNPKKFISRALLIIALVLLAANQKAAGKNPSAPLPAPLPAAAAKTLSLPVAF